MELKDLLESAMKKGASDVHLKVGIVPVIRRHGVLRPLDGESAPVSAESMNQIIEKLLDPDQRQQLKQNKELDLGFGVPGLGRFRVNVFLQRGTLRLVIRNIPHKIPTFAELSLPPVLEQIADNERGLVLVTGVTGAGKSSTLAAMLDFINRSKNKHILTIEDPIEFLIRDRKSIVSQRELGSDTTTFSRALRAALRQDPDVILIGEMRDRETTEIALLAAETGHLVLSTLHTMDATETINRIVSQFEASHHSQIRNQIAAVLRAIISQRLARRIDKRGFVPAVEVLINNARVREMIIDPQKTAQLTSAMEEGRETWQMQTFDQSLFELMIKNLISYEEASRLASNAEDFRLRHSGISRSTDKQSFTADEDLTEMVEPEIELDIDQAPEPVPTGSHGDRGHVTSKRKPA